MGTLNKKMMYTEQQRTKRSIRHYIIPLLAFLLVTSIGVRLVLSLSSSPKAFTLRSAAFQPESSIPPKFAKGKSLDDSISPPLQWSGIPAGTVNLALIVEDPDAPDPIFPKMTWVHWVLYNLPPTIGSLPEDVDEPLMLLPIGAKQALNDWKVAGYVGPSPPIGRHRYYFKLTALDVVLPDLGPTATKAMVEEAFDGHILGQAVLMGTYEN